MISSFSSLRGAGFSGSVGFSDVSDGAAFSGWVGSLAAGSASTGGAGSVSSTGSGVGLAALGSGLASEGVLVGPSDFAGAASLGAVSDVVAVFAAVSV